MTAEIASRWVEVEGMRLHYLEAGSGEPVLLLHGWPTSSFLWRNVMPAMAARNRVLALDLPGFGRSDKPLDASYSFRFYAKVLDGFCERLGLARLSLVVHDLGGPIGLYWTCRHPDRVAALGLLNTIVYASQSWAVMLFVGASYLPGVRDLLVSPAGLRFAMWLGIQDATKRTDEVMRGVLAPFESAEARRALVKAAHGLHPNGMKEIERVLPTLTMPVRAIYGEGDWILPDVAQTMRRVAQDLPQAEVTALPDCGHFLQEDRPEQIGELLAEFLARAGSVARAQSS